MLNTDRKLISINPVTESIRFFKDISTSEKTRYVLFRNSSPSQSIGDPLIPQLPVWMKKYLHVLFVVIAFVTFSGYSFFFFFF